MVLSERSNGLKPERWLLNKESMCKKYTNTCKVGSRWFSGLSVKTPTKDELLFVQY